MIRSRNQNSFLAVATLGVYLGLILAGATPTVLAQAATAKQFNVKDEAGRKDELDKKPDGCDSISERIARRSDPRFNSNHPVVKDEDLLHYATALQSVFLAFGDLRTFPKLDGVEWETATSDDPLTHLPITRVSDWRQNTRLFLVDAKTNTRLNEKVLDLSGWIPKRSALGKPYFHFTLGGNESELVAYASISTINDRDALAEAEDYGLSLELYRCTITDKSLQYLVQNTEVGFSNTSLTITTRLPRGSLDTLLASNAK